MTVTVKLLDLFDLTCGISPRTENVMEYGLQLVLRALIHHLNVIDLNIELKKDDSMIIQELIQQGKAEVHETAMARPSQMGCDSKFPKSSDVGSKHTSGNKICGRTVSDRQCQLNTLDQTFLASDEGLSSKNELNTNESFIYVYQALDDSEIQAAEYEEVRFPETNHDPEGEHVSTQGVPEKAKPLLDEIPGSEIIEKTCLDFLTKFSEDCGHIKQIIDKMHEMFGTDAIETFRLIRQAADLADNNRLRQMYFHEGIHKKIQQAGPDEEYKPIRRGVREIVLRRAKDLAKDEQMKVGDLTTSKEEILREEKLLSKLADIEEPYAKKSEKEIKRSIILPIMTPDEVTITKLNEIIKEHEDIKSYIEYLIYHVNTLADFSEASIPLIFANDPTMEGLQQRVREIHLTPSEYIVTKKLQRELKDFFETFVARVGDFEKRITNQTSLLHRLKGELDEKTKTLGSSIDEVRVCVRKISKKLNTKMDAKKGVEPKSEEMLNRFHTEVEQIKKDKIKIFGDQKKIALQLQMLECVLEKMKDEISNLKAVKLEKIELQKLLSTKADCNLLNAKVSQTQFSLAFNNLTSGLTCLSNQIGAQNFIWESLIKKVINKLTTTIDRDEFEVSMETIVNVMMRLPKMVIRLREKKDAEACATKTKYLRNLTCLSCNRMRAMKTANPYTPFPALPKLPPSHNIKQDPAGPTRNTQPSSSTSEFVNRYVGGDHTVIKPMEKVQQEPENMEVALEGEL